MSVADAEDAVDTLYDVARRAKAIARERERRRRALIALAMRGRLLRGA